MNKIQIIVNNGAGTGSAVAVWKETKEYLQENGISYNAYLTRYEKHAVKLAGQICGKIPQGPIYLLVVGGDGTINICVNAMIRHDIRLPLALLPAGTANDFAYYFDIPSSIEYQLDIALGTTTSPADVGVVNDRNFVNVAAMGALIDVSQKTDPNLKNVMGTLAYYLKAVTELPQLRALPVTLTTPDEVMEEEIYFMVVMNGESAGGFRKLSPQSSINDGKLDVIAFRKMPIVELGPLLFEVVKGRHPKNKNVLSFQTEKLRIESPEDISTDIDGEHGEKLPLEFSVLHNRLEVFVSPDAIHYDRF